MLLTLKRWAQERARVAVSYGNLDRYGTIVTVDDVGLVLRTDQGDVCLPWSAVRQVRSAPSD